MLYPTELRDHAAKIAKRGPSHKPRDRLDAGAGLSLGKIMSFVPLIRMPVVLVMALWLSACGGATLMSPADEARIGAAQHQRILEEFGGAYDDPKVTAYVEGVLARIAQASDKPSGAYRITVLDTPVVNAFALPGGYTYVTRGLLALANSEAELAGVIGHEIAHVTARHGARRHTAAVGTAVIAGVLGAVISAGAGVDPNVTGELINAGGGLLLASYSRDNEYEADRLGIEALARAGYDPLAQADFLAALGAYAKYQNGGEAPSSGWFASHPNNQQRVAHAREKAKSQKLSGVAARHGDRHMAALQGLVFGDGPKQGVVIGARFAHADLGVAFEVPRGFTLNNGKHRVTAKHANGVQIIFDLDARHAAQTPGEYMQTKWAAGAAVEALQPLRIEGREAAEGEVETANGIAVLLALDYDATRIMRFGVLAPAAQKSAARQTMRSLKRRIDFLTAAQIAAIQPLRLQVVRARRGDTYRALASRMAGPSQGRLALLRVLNQAEDGAEPIPGQPIKLVTR